MTISQVLASMQAALDCVNDENPALSASWIVRELLGLAPSELALRGDDALTAEQVDALEIALERRISGEPLQYITGNAPFRYLDMKAKRGVFIPRPETEIVVSEVLDALDSLDVEHPSVLDLCCGSGTIAVSVAYERKTASLTAVDLNPEAVALSIENAQAAGVSERVEVLQGDLFAPLGEATFDIIVSNPPYIPSKKLESMPAEVVDYEPMLALDGGADGLDTFRRILACAHEHLSFGGYLICELDEDTLDAAADLCAAASNIHFESVRVVSDLSGRPRVLVAKSSAHRIKVGNPDDSRALELAARHLEAGEAIVFPTDTVFGIGVMVSDDTAPDPLFEIKRRPKSMSIPWLVSGASDLDRYGKDIPDYCRAIADAYWPGALTLIVKASDDVASRWTADDSTIAVRFPDCKVVSDIIATVGRPLATTSANISGRDAVADAQDLDPELTCQVPLVLEQGRIESGVASTIVSCVGDEPVVIRQGAITAEMIQAAAAGVQ